MAVETMEIPRLDAVHPNEIRSSELLGTLFPTEVNNY